MAVGRRGGLEGREESLSSVIRIESRRKSPEVKEEALPRAIESVGGGKEGGESRAEERGMEISPELLLHIGLY